jgi:hypothetical protein
MALGSSIDQKVAEPFTAEPDRLWRSATSTRCPRSDLATAGGVPGDVGDAELVGDSGNRTAGAVVGGAAVTGDGGLSRRPVFLPDRARDEDAELRSAGAQVEWSCGWRR